MNSCTVPYYTVRESRTGQQIPAIHPPSVQIHQSIRFPAGFCNMSTLKASSGRNLKTNFTNTRWCCADNLKLNVQKTQYFTASKTDDSWKSVKLLGSHLGPVEDVSARMSSANRAFGTVSWKRHTLNSRLAMFSTLILPVLLYNCGLWTLSKTLTSKLDTWHRRKLRIVLLPTSEIQQAVVPTNKTKTPQRNMPSTPPSLVRPYCKATPRFNITESLGDGYEHQ